MDRISQLPEPLLHHILSFLSYLQVSETRIVSKKWLHLWNTYPILRFIEGSVVSPGRGGKLLHVAEQTLLYRQTHMVSIKEFRLYMIFASQKLAPSIDQCVHYAIERNVERLNLDFRTPEKIGMYIVPDIVLGATCLAEISLSGCRLERPPLLRKFSSLRKLNLTTVRADDESMRNLIAGCPLLQEMKVCDCSGFKTLSVASLVKLTILEVEFLEDGVRIEVGSLNLLHRLYLSGIAMRQEINLASCCKNLRTLKLSYTLNVRDEWLTTQISKLNFLETLILTCCYMKNAKIVSHCLETLVITGGLNLTRLEISAPNLHKLDYSGKVISFSSDPLALSELNLRLSSYLYSAVKAEDDWFKGVIQLLKFNHSAGVINLELYTDKHCIVPKKLRETLSPPLYDSKRLNLTINSDERKHHILEVVDAILWISPHLENLSINCYKTYRSSFKFTYGKACSSGCCKSIPVSCWEHCIKKINMTVSKIGGERKEYLVEDDILKKLKDCLDSDFPPPKTYSINSFHCKH